VRAAAMPSSNGMTATPRQVFDRLVAGVAAFRFDELPDLYADVTDVRHPMATPPAEPCVFVLRVRDGVIVESRDYIDPIRSAEARRSLDALADHLRSLAD
jgi:hypothetical protein